MSRFYSEMITWSTVAMTGGAVLLGNLDFPPAGADTKEPPAKEAPVAMAQVEQVTDYPDALDRAPSDPFAGIKRAELEKVIFTATEKAPARVTAEDRPTGRVTATSLNLRAGPGTSFAVVGRATGGQELSLTGDRDGVWIEVELAGADGPAWAHGRYVDAPER